MKPRKIFYIFTIAFGLIMLFALNGYALSIIQGTLNEPVNMSSSRVPVSSETLPDTIFYKWVKNVFGKSYIGVVKFPVVPGESYTLYIKLPMDEVDRNYTLTGSDPYKSQRETMSFQGPDKSKSSYYKCNALTRRINITISPKSNSPLYIIYKTSKPSIPTTIWLKSPKDPDATVDKIAPYPGCSSNVKEYWGGIWKNPILLAKDPNLKEASGDKKFTGTWIRKDDPNSKLYIKRLGTTYYISLKRGGNTIKGVGVSYRGKLIGTFVSSEGETAGNLRISFNNGNLVVEGLSLECRLSWKIVYVKR